VFKSTFKFVLVISLLATHVGCTSLQPISKHCANGVCTASVVAGDTVVIDTRDKRVLALKVQQADTQRVLGMTEDKPPRMVSVAVADIVSIQKRTFSAGRTTGAVVGTGFAVGAVIVTIGAIGLATALIAL